MGKIGMIGFGVMGRVHYNSYAKIPNAEVVAVCDSAVDFSEVNVPKGNIASSSEETPIQETGVDFFTDIDSMLENGGFDGVDICLPTHLHASAAVAALEAGYHVICEKPMALDVESTQNMIDASRRAGKVLLIAHCLRFWPAYVELRKYQRDGIFGDVRYACFERHGGSPDWAGDSWFADPAKSGGALLDLHIHDTDIILHLFGRPENVYSRGIMSPKGGTAHVSTLYGYPDKVIYATGGWMAMPSYGFVMRAFVEFERATAELDFSREDILRIHPAEGESYAPALDADDGYYHELVEYANALDTGKSSGIITPEDAAQTVEVCLLEERSVVEGRPIAL